MVATVNPVAACVTRRMTAQAKIIELITKPFISVIADFGVGNVDISTSSEHFNSFLYAKKKSIQLRIDFKYYLTAGAPGPNCLVVNDINLTAQQITKIYVANLGKMKPKINVIKAGVTEA